MKELRRANEILLKASVDSTGQRNSASNRAAGVSNPSRLPVFVIVHLIGEVLRRPVESTQYLAIRYPDRLLKAGIESSVGSRGDAYDNALAETINGLYKTEVIHHLGPWKGLEDVEYATLEWVAWYNSQRLMEPLGYVPPAVYEEIYPRAKADQSVEALN